MKITQQVETNYQRVTGSQMSSRSWRRRGLKIFVWTASVILGLLIAGLAFVFFSPDYDLYFVKSGSMQPSINVGDMVLAGPQGSAVNIRPGDIITYKLDNNLITHRVLSVNGNTLITKGDANEDADSRPVQFSQIQSRYLFKIPYVGYLNGFLRSKPGWFLLIILPGMVLVGFLLKSIIKEALRDEKRVKNLLKTEKPAAPIVRENDPLKAIIGEALMGYYTPEMKVAGTKNNQKII